MEKEIAMPRAVKSQMIKRQIYDAAKSLLKEYGYEYITVSNICKLAHVSTGSFYHYYESKEALMTEFYCEAYEKFKQHFKAECKDKLEALYVFYSCYSDFCQEQGLAFIRNFYTPFNRSMDMKSGKQSTGSFGIPSMVEIESIAKEYIDQGYFATDVSATTIAEDLCIIEKGCIFEWCISDGSFVIRELSDRLMRTYLQAYLAKGV